MTEPNWTGKIDQRMRLGGSLRYVQWPPFKWGWIRLLLCTLFVVVLQALPFMPTALQAQLPWHSAIREDQLLDSGWSTAAGQGDTTGAEEASYAGFEKQGFADQGWKRVSLPHNWDDYGGYVRSKHGNRHGNCWYRKTFKANYRPDQAFFLLFEGVSSYARVYLNGHLVGKHSGGRTSFTLEVTPFLKRDGSDNLLALAVQHPASIRDLPWVCGGCSDEVGFSEGSQPMGIFRPVHLIQTGKTRIVPFGVHIYNDTTVNERKATLFWETTLKNYAVKDAFVQVRQQLLDKTGKVVAESLKSVKVAPEQEQTLSGRLELAQTVHLWSLVSPYLYHLKTTILEDRTGKPLDELETPYGIRWIKWPDIITAGSAKGKSAEGPRQFLLNGQPVFINGIAGYEHALGKSHAFTAEEIATRVAMIRSMGFNAFRDAHQPHNLRFQHYWDSCGVLWWPQFSAHIWFDSPAFRKNFLRLLKDWVLERRNSPSVILWGLQNESQLPAEFARQCADLIRSLDPTASSQRLITTCNGGEGTDWDVPQNWSGTYGGDPDLYGEDLKRELLVGEYGGWRTMDLHSEGGFNEKGPYSIESWCGLLEKKIRQAYLAADSVCGQFLWLFNAHDNPGRVQAADGFRDLDRIGPVNYKGLLTSWEEPTEGVYLFKANFTGADTAPMVHIASHQWADRWTGNQDRKDIIVYSNCDSVILYNGTRQNVLGVRTRRGIGTHFTWKAATLRYNTIYAVGYYNGEPQVTDLVRFRNLPPAPAPAPVFLAGDRDIPGQHKKMKPAEKSTLLAPVAGYEYLYRYNCGGPAFTDHLGHKWAADRSRVNSPGRFGSASWTKEDKGLPAFFASQRFVTDPIEGTVDEALLQTFRYGREKLDFSFPVPPGEYLVELFFIEPWWGIGTREDCTGWRDFDVAVNGQVRLHHLDIFKEAGSLKALKKQIAVKADQGKIRISFPRTYSGQAVISAIAIARIKNSGNQKNRNGGRGNFHPAPAPMAYVSPLAEKAQQPAAAITATHFQVQDWLATGDTLHLACETVSAIKPGAGAFNSTISSAAGSKAGAVAKTGSLDGGAKGDLSLREFTVTDLPSALFGAQWLQRRSFPGDEGRTKAIRHWMAHQEINMYVAIPRRQASIKPLLLKAGFFDSKTAVGIHAIAPSQTRMMGKLDSLQVYVKQLPSKTTIEQADWWQNCLVAFKPVSHMQPPYDQKTETDYGIKKALFTHNGQLGIRADKKCAVFAGVPIKEIQNGDTEEKPRYDSIYWPLVTGVADFHSFQVKYAYPGRDSVAAVIQLVAADGKLMASNSVWFTPTKEGKWNSSYLLTPTMVNAGRYRLVVRWKLPNQKARQPAAPLYIYSMKCR